MSDVPTPTGYDVYWEKWIDAFEEEIEEEVQIDEEGFIEEEMSDTEEGPSYEDQIMSEGIFKQSMSHIRSIITPFGVLPITEKTMASRYFKLWVGHANFKLTEDFYTVIGQSEGVEALDILTPYRFRIAIGKLFVDRKVMKAVRDKMVSHVDGNVEDDKQTQ